MRSIQAGFAPVFFHDCCLRPPNLPSTSPPFSPLAVDCLTWMRKKSTFQSQSFFMLNLVKDLSSFCYAFISIATFFLVYAGPPPLILHANDTTRKKLFRWNETNSLREFYDRIRPWRGLNRHFYCVCMLMGKRMLCVRARGTKSFRACLKAESWPSTFPIQFVARNNREKKNGGPWREG